MLKYRADIDGLRALAVWMVVLFHSFPSVFPGGYIGVDVFFVISGYLISSILFKEMEKNIFSFSGFYARRIRRIFPSLILILTLSYVVGWIVLFPSEFEQLGKHVAGGASFISNIILWNEFGYFDKASELKPLLHLWSLGIEEQFYIIWPLLLYLGFKLNYSILRLICLITLLSFFWNILWASTNHVAAFYSPQTRLWELLFGALIGYVSFKQITLPAILTKEHLATFGFFLLLVSMFYFDKGMTFPGFWALVPTITTSLIIISSDNSLINKNILSSKIFVFFGLISYPLYLWHWPILSFMHIIFGEAPENIFIIAAIIFSILLSWITYRFIEIPFRKGGDLKKKTIILLSLMSLVSMMGLAAYFSSGFPKRNITKFNPEAYQEGTFKSNPKVSCNISMSNLDASKWCEKFIGEEKERLIVVWGDSTSGAWLPVFQDIAHEKGLTIVHITHPSCPPILEVRKTKFLFPESRKYCKNGKMQEEVIHFIRDINPDLIFLMGAWAGPDNGDEYVIGSKPGYASKESTQKVIKNLLPKTIDRLAKISDVVVFKSWPVLPRIPNYETKRSDFFSPKDNTTHLSTSEFDRHTQLINSVFSKIKNSRVTFFDPSKKICNKEWCNLILDGQKLYKDVYHITPQGALLYKRDIERLIDKNS